MNLFASINQLNDFINDTADFPHKCVPLKIMPIKQRAIFHCFANANANAHGQMTEYGGRYTHDQLITMDLVINPQRFSSWLALLKIKIAQFDKIYDEIDLTK